MAVPGNQAAGSRAAAVVVDSQAAAVVVDSQAAAVVVDSQAAAVVVDSQAAAPAAAAVPAGRTDPNLASSAVPSVKIAPTLSGHDPNRLG
jgi:hypothetical protein